MTVIEKLQQACEHANLAQAEADELGYGSPDMPSGSDLFERQQRAQALSRSASDQAYAFSQAILLQSPENERGALILLAHLVQQLGLIAADHRSPQTELAHKAAQALLRWHANGTQGSNLDGWALEAIVDTQVQTTYQTGSTAG